MPFRKGEIGFTERQRNVTQLGATQLESLKQVTLSPGVLTDLFFRTAVSNPETLFDSKQIYADAQEIFWDDVQADGSGTSSTFSQNQARTTLAVSANTLGARIRQTKMSFNYQPGKSQEVIITGVLRKDAETTALGGIRRGWGFGNDKNGIFLIDDEGTIKIVIRTYTSGDTVEVEYPQSEWADPLDGTGSSGVTLDWSKSQIFAFRFEWLGVGGIRVLFGIDNKPVLGTEIYHANQFNTVYMSTPNLPIRYFIENDGTGGAASLDAICCTVISEGGSQDTGQIRGITTNGTTITLTTTAIWYGLIGIRLKSTDLGAIVKVLKTSLVVLSASNDIEWCLAFNPTLRAGSTTFEGFPANSSVNYQICNGSQTFEDPDYILDFGYASSGGGQAGSAGVAERLDTALRLGSAVDETRDEIFLMAKGVNGSASVEVQCGILWRELS